MRTRDITLHRLDLAAGASDCGLLDDADRARALRRRQGAPRNRFVAGRALLRRVLAEHVGRPPASLRFAYGAHGKPRLAEPGGPAFNLAHSGDVAVVAVAWGTEVGVDVEHVRFDRRYEAIARRFFPADECKAIADAPARARAAMFYRLWCAHEAHAKALGTGLRFGARLAPLDGISPYRFETLDLARDVVAAVCWRGGYRTVVVDSPSPSVVRGQPRR